MTFALIIVIVVLAVACICLAAWAIYRNAETMNQMLHASHDASRANIEAFKELTENTQSTLAGLVVPQMGEESPTETTGDGGTRHPVLDPEVLNPTVLDWTDKLIPPRGRVEGTDPGDEIPGTGVPWEGWDDDNQPGPSPPPPPEHI